MTGVFVKNQRFDLPALLGDARLAEKYAHGTVVLSRLCPVDYHRFHFPAAGVPEAPVRIPGPLASVSPYCLRHNLAWLWTNKRELTVLHTEELGDVLCLAVGATGHLVKAVVFPIVMYGCESWPVKKAEHRRIDAFEVWVLEKTLESPLDYKEIKPVDPKENQP